jgi:hypothetical protein
LKREENLILKVEEVLVQQAGKTLDLLLGVNPLKKVDRSAHLGRTFLSLEDK